ncbi:hypothetical protein H4O14_16745 [Bacillus sp. PAMC26568]|nr:hypothetical protein H4O14_16745 [Bacillus sp. PAMC26568]
MAKCPKCENDSFKIVKDESNKICFVQCIECESAIGVLEDVDFKDSYKTIKEKLNLITNNQTGLERVINIRTNEIKSELKKELGEQHDKINYILNVAEKLNQKL